MKRLLNLAVFLLFALCTACIQAPTSDDQHGSWSETCEAFSKIDITATTTVPVDVKDTGGSSSLLMKIPTQAFVCCDSTTTGCWATYSMDVDSDGIDQLVSGVFAADDHSFYSAGRGKTHWIPSDKCLYVGVRSARNFFDNGLPRAGARKSYCSTTLEPCAVDAECSSGTCDSNGIPSTTYFFIESVSGTGNIRGHVCDG